jgi:aconitase A
VQNPPYFEGMGKDPVPGTITTSKGARVLGLFGDKITTDHISPAGAIKAQSPAGEYLPSEQVSAADFNSYGSRRGNHEVMMRGTFANIRIKNQMLDRARRGRLHLPLPDGEQMSIYDAAMRYRRKARRWCLRRQGIRHRLVARLGGEGHQPAGRQGGDRRASSASTAPTWSAWASSRFDAGVNRM